MRLGFVFRSFPHSSTRGREGLDALLATSAYCEAIDVFFLGLGVTQLLSQQDPEQVLSKNYLSAFKLLSLYDIDEVFICQDSLMDFGIEPSSLLMEVTILDRQGIAERMKQCHRLLTF